MGNSVVRMVMEIKKIFFFDEEALKKIYDRHAYKEDLLQHDNAYSEDCEYEYDSDYSYPVNYMSDYSAYEEESEPEFDYGDDSPFEGIPASFCRRWLQMVRRFRCLTAYPKGYNFIGYLSLYLEVADNGSLPFGWRRHARYTLTLVNQNSKKSFQPNEVQEWFDDSIKWGCPSMFPLNEIHAKDSGFLVNGELKIVAEIDILEVIGDVDVSEGISTVKETIHVNGFQLLPSQSPQELSKDDLCDVYIAIGCMKNAGFRLDWLENKLYEVAQKKEDDEAGETRLREMEEKLKDLKLKCSKMEALVEEEKAKVSAAKAHLSFDDVV
ncbi:unnamed protein product [Arabidopsis thaliana]|uniref:MATH domain-containing protein n=1 Tax=Arabidopsis thaliana TaxID=3702 RepID=A0A654FIY0_ARATH|nr:unnamed protein product [Arabidopsis thaliana]